MSVVNKTSLQDHTSLAFKHTSLFAHLPPLQYCATLLPAFRAPPPPPQHIITHHSWWRHRSMSSTSTDVTSCCCDVVVVVTSVMTLSSVCRSVVLSTSVDECWVVSRWGTKCLGGCHKTTCSERLWLLETHTHTLALHTWNNNFVCKWHQIYLC